MQTPILSRERKRPNGEAESKWRTLQRAAANFSSPSDVESRSAHSLRKRKRRRIPVWQ